MAVGQPAISGLDSLAFPDQLGKRDYTNFDQTSSYFYENATQDDEDSLDQRKPGRKKDPNEPETKRRAQNRAAQRAFRERKERHLKDLETRVHELEQSARSWQNSNLMLRTKLSALEDELEHYRSGRVPQLATGAPTLPDPLNTVPMGVPPIEGLAAQSQTWSTSSLSQAPLTLNSTAQSGQAMSQEQLDPLNPVGEVGLELLELEGPASVLPARSASITGLHGPATVLPLAKEQILFDQNEYFGRVQPSTTPTMSTSSSTPYSVPSEFTRGDSQATGAPPLVDITTSSASSASSEQSPWEGSKFCEQLQQAACPLPKLPLASQTPQIAPLTADWEQQPTSLEFSFGYREPTPHDAGQSNFSDLLNTDYGFFDPLEDPLKPQLEPLEVPEQPFNLSNDHSPLYQDQELYALGLSPPQFGARGDFVKSEQLSPLAAPPGVLPAPSTASPDVESADEVPAKSRKYMTCQAVWDRVCSHPNFEGINLDELCSEFQAKARCSDSGVVLTEEDVDTVLKHAPRKLQA